jgi:hypothetical protein
MGWARSVQLQARALQAYKMTWARCEGPASAHQIHAHEVQRTSESSPSGGGGGGGPAAALRVKGGHENGLENSFVGMLSGDRLAEAAAQCSRGPTMANVLSSASGSAAFTAESVRRIESHRAL